VQPLVQRLDLLLLLAHLGPQLGHLGPLRQDQGASFGRQAIPQLGGEWRVGAHSADIARRSAPGHVIL
jgi:hypothetical protein